jgi:hypothetical protein
VGYDALLRQAGYRRADSLLMRRHGGFTGSVAQEGLDSYCGDSAMVVVSRLDSTQAPRSLAVTMVTDANAVRQCGEGSASYQTAFTAPLRLPPLRPPRGVNTQPVGLSSSGNSFEATALLDTTLSADSVLAHYSTELVAGGWRLLATPARADGFAARQLLAPHGRGAPRRGAAHGEAARVVAERATRPAPPAPPSPAPPP